MNETDAERKAETVKAWIKQFSKTKGEPKAKTAFVVYGPSGSGKSYQMKRIAKEYDTVYLDSSCVDKKTLFAAIEEAGNYTFPGLTKLVIVDDFDVIAGSDKNERLKKFLKARKNKTPLVFVCDQNTKRLKDYNTVCEFLKFEKVSQEDARILAERLLSTSPLQQQSTSQTITELAEYTEGDVRNLIQMIDQMKQSRAGANEGVTELSRVFTKKDQDPSLYDIVNIIPNRKISFVEGVKYFDLERVLVPFLVHENYCDWIEQSSPKSSSGGGDLEALSACSRIMAGLSDFDLIETNVYLNPGFDVESCTLSLSALGINAPNKTVLDYKTKVGTKKEIKYTPARFTNMISKLASKKARETLILNLHTKYGQMEKDVILLLRNKIARLIQNKTSSGIKLAVDTLLIYDLDPLVVDSLMRMFVFKGSAQEKEFGYTAKMKELLTKEYTRQKEETEKKQRKRINIFR